MKKFLLTTLSIVLFLVVSRAQFGISSSAVCLNVNGSSGLYNTQGSLGRLNFSNNLGTFGSNSGNLKLMGGAINTFKSNDGNICGGALYYSVYPKNNRPAVPVFTALPFTFYSTAGITQKWQDLSKSIDLTTYSNGDYAIEIYYQASGSDASLSLCTQQRTDNAAGQNYVATFSITSPLALNFSSLYGISNDYFTEIKWATQNDENIVSYEIQKSDNGLNFTTIGTINSKRSNTVNSYYFNDKSPYFGANYYRIKVNNDNSTVNLSNVVRLYFGTVGNSLLIYPNPSGNILTIRLAGIPKGNYQLSVLGNNGQQITTTSLKHDGVDKTLHINLPVTLSKGLYRLFLIDKVQFFKQAFLVR